MLASIPRQLSDSQRIHLTPWVGRHYQTSKFGLKVLLLGESVYAWDPDDRLYVCTLVERYIKIWHGVPVPNEEGGCYQKHPFWSRLMAAIDHPPQNGQDFEEFYQNVAYANFIQEILPGSRTSPTRAQFQAAGSPFLEMLGILKPDIAVCLGRRMWDWMPNNGRDLQAIGAARLYMQPFQGGETLLVGIEHPSSGRFSSDKWRPLVQAAFELARQRVDAIQVH